MKGDCAIRLSVPALQRSRVFLVDTLREEGPAYGKLPESLKTPLQEHLEKVKKIHEQDLANGWGRGVLPYFSALIRHTSARSRR